MSMEARYSVSLGDIAYVQLTCKKCQTRTSMAPEKWEFLYACPNPTCKAEWWSRHTMSEKDNNARAALNCIAKANEYIGEREFVISLELKNK